MNQRTQRISAVLREAIQTTISRGLQDPRVRGLITVTKVTVADDLTQATVHVSVMPIEHAELTMHGLRAAAPHIRRQVGTNTTVNRVPSLLFKLDTASAKQAEVLGAIARATRELEEKDAAKAAAEADGVEQSQEPSQDAGDDER